MREGTEIGAWFEVILFRAFKRLLEQKTEICAVRLYDTKAARNYLPEQPGDFIVGLMGFSLLLEAKASTVRQTLQVQYKSAIRPSQIVGARKWMRAGLHSVFIFCGTQERVLELWDGGVVVAAWVEGVPRLPIGGRRAVVNWTTEEDLVDKIGQLITQLGENLSNDSGYLQRFSYRRKVDGQHDARLEAEAARKRPGQGSLSGRYPPGKRS